MPPTATALLAVLALSAPPCARAAAVACWFDRGAVVVPARVGGVAGDYILDTGTAHTALAETQAQGAGYGDTALVVDVRMAGLDMRRRPVAVLDLDARTRAFPTPIAGVIGADILAGHVLDVRFAPCRVALWTPGRTPRIGRARVLPIKMRDGVPVLAGAVADGSRAASGELILATGSDTAVRLDASRASASLAGRPAGLLPYGDRRPRLRALSLAGGLWENLSAGLIAPADLPPGVLGVVGTPVLSAWTLRFDFPRGRLRIAQ